MFNVLKTEVVKKKTLNLGHRITHIDYDGTYVLIGSVNFGFWADLQLILGIFASIFLQQILVISAANFGQFCSYYLAKLQLISIRFASLFGQICSKT